MPIEGWRSLLESTTWGDCVITLHNLPFPYAETTVIKKPVTNVVYTYLSLYELQKSAASWQLPDFKDSLNR